MFSKSPPSIHFIGSFLVFLCLLFISSVNQVFSKQQEIHKIKADSLFKLYNQVDSDTDKLYILSELVQEIHYSDTALKYYQEAIELSKLLGNKHLEAQNINRLGVYYRNMNLQEEALQLYEEALELSLESGDQTQIGHSLNNIGQMYYYKEYFDEALSYYLQARKYFEEVNDKNGLGYNFTGMSLVLGELGRYKEAVDLIDKAILIREELGELRQVMVSKFNRADLLLDLGIYDEAEKDIWKLYEYGVANDYIRAINALSKLVELKVKIGEKEEAIKYAELAQKLHEEKPFSESMIEIYQMMNQVYFNLGDLEMSKKYQNLLQAERNIIKNEKTKVYLAGLTIKNQKEQIDFLNREKALIKENEKFKLYLTAGLIISLLVISIAYLLVYRALKREKVNLKLLSQQKEEIELHQQELQRLNHVKDKIFSILAHDLKGPLNSLSGLIKLIQEDGLTKEEFESYIPIIAENLGSNNILLENILVWSRSQMKGLEVVNTEIDIQALVQKNIEYLYHSGYYKGQVMINDITPKTMASADKNMLDIIIRNLLSNALKFTKKNDQVIISSSIKGTNLVIKISDEGVGILRKNLEKLFGNEFFSTPGTHQERGTGIGLILTKELVQINKGTIWVESEYGAGSTFYFEIPRA
ncbi:signal transduction histidine kinase [Belliella baltica DSM 15883]|uniref:histidine kinase n=1 Tax=Belliella baltica (strain DSM 15883 / CIP 108006 / LMG 21964 / BA134) TaxID=866536 RepID=I3Z8B0_BELBD|nr:ATP-binding protein [Belliella baltica]AFL85478.1 signal transduction histidine kinase [Belliella baltica DSM 15883]